MAGGIIEEVGPVGVCLHESELEQLPQTQPQELEADLQWGGVTDISDPSAPLERSLARRQTVGPPALPALPRGSALPTVPRAPVPGSGCPGSSSGTGPGAPLRPAPCPEPALCTAR